MTHRNVTQRIELFLLWLKFFELFLKMTQRIELFSNLTQRSELFSICLQELNPFLKKITPRIELCKKYDTKNWTFSFLKKSDSKIGFFETLRKEPFFNLTLRIEPFFLNVTQRVELSLIWHQ